jgi:hypothetical protein
LNLSGVISGTYGNSFNIPVFSVNSFGQITDVTTSEISPLPAGGLTSQLLTYNNQNVQAWVYSDGGTW